jgi:hypothetical protein
MSAAPLIAAICGRLTAAGYSALATPCKVAGVEFSFTAAMRGRDGRALDLILLFDTTTGDFGDRDADRIRQRVEALGRALDVTGSRYVVTAILAGAALSTSTEALAEICRVLHVDDAPLNEDRQAVSTQAARALDDQILLLLPLTLPRLATGATDGSGAAIEQLLKALPEATRPMATALVAVSSDGEEAVAEAAGLAVAAAFKVADTENEA